MIQIDGPSTFLQKTWHLCFIKEFFLTARDWHSVFSKELHCNIHRSCNYHQTRKKTRVNRCKKHNVTSKQQCHSSYCCFKLFPSQSHTVQVFWAGMKIECFHCDGTITPLTAREKCSIQASRITKKLHETSHRASHDILVDRMRRTYRLELVLRWTDESPTSLHQADNRHCLKRSIMTVSWRLNCCYCFSQGKWEAQSSLPIGYACPDKEHTPLTRLVFLPFAFLF